MDVSLLRAQSVLFGILRAYHIHTQYLNKLLNLTFSSDYKIKDSFKKNVWVQM